MGQKYIESIDTNGDGEPDCEVYSYTFAANVTVAIDPYFSVHLAESGRIYFLTTITKTKDLDNPDNWPEGYDPTHDYLCIDSLNYEQDPNIHLHNSSNCWAEPKMIAITKEIEEYGNNHTNPAYGWGRESYEMVGEWKSHNNVLFSFSEQAKHVDFDRNEKNKGFGYFFFKAVKRFLGIM